MTTQETTPKQVVQPRTFVIELNEAETKNLFEQLSAILKPGIGDAATGRIVSFANIRAINAPGQPQTSQVQYQLIQAPATTATTTTPVALKAAAQTPSPLKS